MSPVRCRTQPSPHPRDSPPLTPAAKLHPERTYYYRKVVDLDRLIEQCAKKVSPLTAQGGEIPQQRDQTLALPGSPADGG